MSQENTFDTRALIGRIEAREATVGIIGLGYVGLPLGLALVERDFNVVGFDIDEGKISALMGGESYIAHIESERVAAAVKSGRFEATVQFERLGEPDAILICVPTPLTSQREPDLSYVEATVREVSRVLRRGQLVILESTTYPGTTDEVLKPILEESGLVCGRDFLLAFSPEREDPGNPDFNTATIPKVVGGVDEASGEVAAALYGQVIDQIVRVTSARTAEATKLTENIFRAVNIALVNELKLVFDPMDIDVWEVLDAADSKPFGFMKFSPGPGWGGHCIPIDPFYLTWKAREHGVATKFIELAGEVNVHMPRYVIGKLQLALNARKKAVNGSRVLVLGIAYKKNVDDSRESPAFVLLDKLEQLGANIRFHDPHVPVLPKTRRWTHLEAIESIELTPENIRGFDAVLVVTDHEDVDYDMIVEHADLVVDTRGIYRTPRDNVVKA
jgi:UDP-N-acetyl-D-glucosamine dehydrogenase